MDGVELITILHDWRGIQDPHLVLVVRTILLLAKDMLFAVLNASLQPTRSAICPYVCSFYFWLLSRPRRSNVAATISVDKTTTRVPYSFNFAHPPER